MERDFLGMYAIPGKGQLGDMECVTNVFYNDLEYGMKSNEN